MVAPLMTSRVPGSPVAARDVGCAEGVDREQRRIAEQDIERRECHVAVLRMKTQAGANGHLTAERP